MLFGQFLWKKLFPHLGKTIEERNGQKIYILFVVKDFSNIN